MTDVNRPIPPSAPIPAPRTGYHHGNLVDAMLQATISLIEEKGVEAVSIREATKRAGVSPGAPFRHFANKTALLTAVAEQAMSRLTEAVTSALAEVNQADPIMGLRAIACGYLSWAFENPTHFQVISSRTLIDFHGSSRLVNENAAIRDLMVRLIAQAKAEGRLAHGIEPEDLMLSARAYFYGLVRMYIDGHFQEWQIRKPPQQALDDARELFFAAITRDAQPVIQSRK
jgi:AcrR family transcriptional regulator